MLGLELGSLTWGWGTPRTRGKVGRLYIAGLGDSCRPGLSGAFLPLPGSAQPRPPLPAGVSSQCLRPPASTGQICPSVRPPVLEPEGKVPVGAVGPGMGAACLHPSAFERTALKPLELHFEL